MPANIKNKIEIMRKIPFVKMHGLGNDFVIIDSSKMQQNIINANFITQILNRRLGIGGDQLILFSLDKSSNENTIVKMDIYNPDGTNAKACGNASRCLAKLMHDQHGISKFTLHVDGRKLQCSTSEEGKYTVNMGLAATDVKWMPSNEKLLELASKYNLGPKDLICIDMGNPHLVIFSKLYQQDMEIIGSQLQNSEIFPDGVNVNFAKVHGNEIELAVYERGTGFTLACGSGACASVAGSYYLGKIVSDAESTEPVIVKFKLGQLEMRMYNNEVIMSGPAEYSFSGEYIYG